MSSAGLNMNDLRTLAERDLAASNELQARIDHLQQQLAEGQKPNVDQTSLMSDEHKRIGRDLVLRMEQIESQGQLNATDRMMLQALTVRLAVHDLQSARLAEYRDLQLRDGGEQTREWLKRDRGVASQAQAGPDPTSEMLMMARSQPDSPQPGTPEFAVANPRGQATGYFADPPSPTPSSHYSDNAESLEDLEEDGSPHPSWPLLYQILNIDPQTPAEHFSQELDNRLRGLALRHDPRYVPNDHSAPQRWAACEKAYAILAEPERRRFYDARGAVPEALVGFDVSVLWGV